MATNSIRVASKRALFETIRLDPDLADVDVRYQAPTGPIERECVFLGSTKGVDTGPANMKAGRKDANDVFSVEIWCVVSREGDGEAWDADSRVEQLFNVVDDCVRSDAKLGGRVDGLLWCFIEGENEGPSPYPIMTERGEQLGWASSWRFEVTFHTRLQ